MFPTQTGQTQQLTSAVANAILKRSLLRNRLQKPQRTRRNAPHGRCGSRKQPCNSSCPAKETPYAVGFLLVVPLVRLDSCRSAGRNGRVFLAARQRRRQRFCRPVGNATRGARQPRYACESDRDAASGPPSLIDMPIPETPVRPERPTPVHPAATAQRAVARSAFRRARQGRNRPRATTERRRQG